MLLPTRRTLLAALAAGLAFPAMPARADAHGSLPPELARALPQARLRGQGRLRFFGFQVYDIRLWSPADVLASRWAETPLALELVYARALEGRSIAERSIEEMRRQSALPQARAAGWLQAMAQLFPDVQEGDRLTGVQQPGIGARFVHNGQPRGEVRDPEFARLFFGIWLSPQSSEPALREQLLGLAAR